MTAENDSEIDTMGAKITENKKGIVFFWRKIEKIKQALSVANIGFESHMGTS